LALSLALAKRPQRLLLDEPLASLDPLARRAFLRTLLDVAAVEEPSVSIILETPSLLLLESMRACQGAHDDIGDHPDATDFGGRLAA
jgi:ABC-type multidrug transport system ATPase subunit